jgi:LysM repeat protein
MSFLGKLNFVFGVLALAVALVGCVPNDPSQMDEEKEPHFVLGRSRVNALDYAGAIEAFQESLEANPHSAAAHFQLACLFDTKISDSAAAIYHYQEYLRLNPRADNAEVVRQRIYSCKQQLAADVMPLPSTPATVKQIEDLTEKNRRLQADMDKLRTDYIALQAAASARPAPTSYTPDDVSAPEPATATAPGAGAGTTTAGGRTVKTSTPRPPVVSRPVVRSRTHTVAPGETLAGIARKYGVSLSALQAANPGISPRKLKSGQTLNIPPT